MKTRLSFALAVAVAIPSVSPAQDWGNLKAKFILVGKPPTPEKLKVDKDIEVCGKHKLVDEKYKINAETGAIQNVVIYLSPKPGTPKPKIHPDYEKAAAEVVLDNHNCHFEPHIVTVRTTQKLVVKNSDPVGHNTKADFFENIPFNDLIPAGASITKTLTKPEGSFMPVSCSIHPWMSAKILVRDDPYAAVSNEKGELTIANLPAGKWTFTIWHEGCGYVQSGSRNGKAEKWTKGKIDFEIKKGDNNLGEFKIPVAVLDKPKSGK
jgi:plastocyanin